MSDVKGFDRDGEAAKRWDRIFKYMNDEPLRFEEIDDLVSAVYDLTEGELDEVIADVEDQMRSKGRFDEVNVIHQAIKHIEKIVEEGES